jgi:hypothetical protein
MLVSVFRHPLFTFLTTSANKIVEPGHAKAMPVLLLTDADIETWLTAPTDEASKLQKPAPDDAVVVLPEEEKAAKRPVCPPASVVAGSNHFQRATLCTARMIVCSLLTTAENDHGRQQDDLSEDAR